ncbi:MAG: hypothetical protein EOM29_07770 [Bacteroidia bacterium]|nr:hypothetical protein [Bacteroidia bacterium]
MKKTLAFIFIALLITNVTKSQNLVEINSQEAYNLIKKINFNSIIIDARDSMMYSNGHIEKAINIDAFNQNSETKIKEYLNRDKIIIYCTNNNRSNTLLELLKKLNYKGEIIIIKDGMMGWLNNEFEIENEIHTSKGSPIIQIFSNLDIDIDKHSQKRYDFNITRAHFGYNYKFNNFFNGKIIIDASRPTTITKDSENHIKGQEGSHYTMYLKFASLEWNPNEKIKIEAGAILQNHYIIQEKFWGYRYVAQTFQDKYYLSPSTDIGMIGYYKINNKIGFDLAITNGEGVKVSQDEFGDIKIGLGIDYSPFKELTTRLFLDYNTTHNPLHEKPQQLLSFFLGYNHNNKIRIGGEYNYRNNHLYIKNHSLYGYSIYVNYNLTNKFALYSRYDNLKSNKIENQENGWDYLNTGAFYILGTQYSPKKNINISINYQLWTPDNKQLSNYKNNILLNLEYRI